MSKPSTGRFVVVKAPGSEPLETPPGAKHYFHDTAGNYEKDNFETWTVFSFPTAREAHKYVFKHIHDFTDIYRVPTLAEAKGYVSGESESKFLGLT